MLTFDSLTLKKWIDENSEFLTGARIQKIQQPTRRDFVFSIRKLGETKKFYININPEFYHICFMNKKNEEKRLIEIPQKPPMFCMLLRKYLENSVISKVAQPPYERILEFYIETYNELGEKIYLCLAIELMGKYSNVVLYSHDTNIIIGCAHNVGSEKSREREMAGTLPYIYPPGTPKIWYACENSLSKSQEPDINNQIDNHYANLIYIDKFKKLKETYTQIVSKKLKKAKNSLLKMSKQGISKEKAEKYRLFGDLIMANLYTLKDYTKSATVFDYENNKEISIELDETKSLKDNAQIFYKLYNKGKSSILKFEEFSKTLNEEIEYLEQILYSLEIASNIYELMDIGIEIQPQKVQKKQGKSSLEPLKFEFDDAKIYVGRNNRQNDYIVSKLSKDEDLWFHTKDCAGSHVLLRSENPDKELIIKSAQLAKEYSKGKNSSKVAVIYTKRKYLKKPPKANLGYVTYKNEQEIII